MIYRLIAAFLFVILPAVLYASQFSPGIQTLRREIQILDSTRQLVSSEAAKRVQRARDRTSISSYIDYLDSRIGGLCAELWARAGQAAAAGLNCPPRGAFLPGYQAPAARTSKEQIEDLDRRLAEELGRFDDMLSTEQQKIASGRRTPSRSQAGTATGSSGGTGGEGAASDAGTEGPLRQNHPQRNESDKKRRAEADKGREQERNEVWQEDQQASRKKAASEIRQEKGSRQGVNAPPPPPISEDDDIVARQLRQAAEAETDPQLREKLWEEYRKYKESRR